MTLAVASVTIDCKRTTYATSPGPERRGRFMSGGATVARTGLTTTQRGYGWTTHQAQRRRWKPIVDAGQAYCCNADCLMSSRWIPPGTPWDLGHTPDRSAWTGPEHRRCNRAEGARRGNRMRGLLRHAVDYATRW